MDDQQTMFRAFALLTGSINIFSVDLVIDMHNFRAYVDDNYFKLRVIKSYELKQTIRIVQNPNA